MQASAPAPSAPAVIVPLVRLDRASLAALAYARSISSSVRAVAVTRERLEAVRIRERWRQRSDGIELDLIDADGDRGERLVEYLDTRGYGTPSRPVVVVLPLTLTGSWLDRLAGIGTLALRRRLARRTATVAVTAPYRV